jgi:hypothetical protein
VSAPAVCCAATTACWAWASFAVVPPGDAGVDEGIVADVVLVVDATAMVVVVVAAMEDEEELELEAWAASSSASLASAAARFVCADVTLVWREVGVSEASVVPASTCWPRTTLTAETVPATWKAAVAW